MLPILLAALESEEDKRLFARFYQAHHKKLYRFALSLLHSPALAEEAVQAAVEDYYKRKGETPPEEALKTE